MNKSNIKLHHCGDTLNSAWYWTDENNKVISPYIEDSEVAERWGKLYKEAVLENMIVINGKIYSANK
jgi:hypothetical protein